MRQPSASEPGIAPRDLAGFPLVGHSPVNPESDIPSLASELVGVPLAGWLDPLLANVLPEVEGRHCVGRKRLAEQVTAGGVAALGLMPHLAVGRVADVDAGVVTLLARNRREPPFDVKDVIRQNLVHTQPLMAAVALTYQSAIGRVERPLRPGIELTFRRDGLSRPAVEFRAGRRQHVDPVLGILLQSARLVVPAGRRQGGNQTQGEQRTIVML